METKLIEEAAGCGDRRGQRGGPPARLAHRSIITAGERDWTTEPVNGWTGPRTGPDRPIGDRVTHARSSSSSHSELHPHSTRFHKERKNNTLRPTLTISEQLRYLTRNMASNCRHATGRRSFSPALQFQDVAVPVFLICGIHVQAFGLSSSQRLTKSHTHMRLGVLLL